MRQISASKRSQNVVEIAKTDYCGFGQVFSFILSHPSTYHHREKHKISSFVSRQLFTASFQYELWQIGYRQARQSIV